MILRSLFQMLAPGGVDTRLTVLIFHRVLPEPDPLFPDEMHAAQFDTLCSWLAAWFRVLPLDAAVSQLKAGTLPARAACITFDDGYEDNFSVAMPILKRRGLTSTFFIATGFLDGGRMWNDTLIEAVRSCKHAVLDVGELGLGSHPLGTTEARRSAIAALIGQIKYLAPAERVHTCERVASAAQVRLPDGLMMTSDQVKAMHRAGMQIGAHTISHPILARLEEGEARREIKGSKDFLERLLGDRVGLFAYPNGKPGEDYVPQSVDIVRGLGFDAAVSTQWGASRRGDDMYQIRRFTPWDAGRARFGARLLANLRSQ